jgi:hypothetical protein
MSDNEKKGKKRKVKPVTPICRVHGGTVKDQDGNLFDIAPVPEGTNVAGRTIVNLGPPDQNGEMEVTTLYEGAPPTEPARAQERSSRGPVHVSNQAYRDTWDRVFGKKKTSDKAN